MDAVRMLEFLTGAGGGEIAWWQMCLRGLMVFAYGTVLVRFFGQRIFGKMAALDIVLAVMVGSNLSRTLTDNAPLLPTLAATTTIVMVHWALARFSPHLRPLAWLVKGRPVRIAAGGCVDWRRLRRAGLWRGDLEEAAREAGLSSIDQIDEAWLERDGKVSILRKG